MRDPVLLLSVAFLSFACSDSSTPDKKGPSSGSPPVEGVESTSEKPSLPPVEVAAEETVATGRKRWLTPEPIGVTIRSVGETQCGPLRIVVEEKEDGQVDFMAHRVLFAGDGEKAEHGGGYTFAAEPNAPWLLYVHTTHEFYGYDGRGGLLKHTFKVDFAEGGEQFEKGITWAEGAPQTESIGETLTVGPEWNPGEELRAELPPQLVELIEGN
ncbi:hypothetical protein N9293_00410 [Planctomycetota bacterium]|nr:hypothetical protein [Planctomycetota bacterium]